MIQVTGEVNFSNTFDLTQYIQNITLTRNQFTKVSMSFGFKSLESGMCFTWMALFCLDSISHIPSAWGPVRLVAATLAEPWAVWARLALLI